LLKLRWHEDCYPAAIAKDTELMLFDAIMRFRRWMCLSVVVLVWTVSPADAQWVVTPYLGGNLAGDVEFRRGGPGASVGYLGDRLGFEFDFERYNHFFKDVDVFPLDPAAPPNCTDAISRETPCTDLNTDAVGFMGNVVVPIRLRGAKNWHPYGTAGLGVIRAWTNLENRSQNNFAGNVGGGVMYSLNSRVALRGDLRYFRAVVNKDEPKGVLFKDYGYLRASFGVTFRFPS
jgi:opacity protein-like surface antigen